MIYWFFLELIWLKVMLLNLIVVDLCIIFVLNKWKC